jgi:hypothetical protein
MPDRAYIEERLKEILQIMDLSECPNPVNRCRCGPVCLVCGWHKHYAVHGPVSNEPKRVFDHYYRPDVPARSGS